jgi:hypothetical protein
MLVIPRSPIFSAAFLQPEADEFAECASFAAAPQDRITNQNATKSAIPV